MKIAALPDDEDVRLLDLHSYDILDSAPEREFDDLVQLASQICKCPISMMTFVDSDRQWFKAKLGLKVNETARSTSFCSHTILSDKMMIVENAWEDERFVDSPLVTGDPNICFYAGAPIISPAGHRVGSICVVDQKPRSLTKAQQAALQIISRQITKLMELRTTNRIIRKRATDIIDLKNHTLEEAIKQRDERDKAVANELHEQIAQKVATCHLYLNMAEQDDDMKNEAIPWIKQTLTEIIGEIRSLTSSLVPSTFGSAPLQVLLNDFIERARSFYHFDIAITFSGYTNELNVQNSIATFRIIEKWVEVLGRKDSVNHISISLHVNDQIELMITDDGSESGFGEMEKTLVMSMVYSRVKMANGTVSYNTVQSRGNVLTMSVPLVNSEL